MNKFKLMQILPSLKSGGVEQGTLDVANYLASLKFKNYICSNGGPMLSHLNRKYVEHFNLPVHSKNFFMMPFVAKKINLILENKSIDILHFRSRAPSWLLPYIKVKDLKTVSTFHNIYGSQNFLKRIYNKQLSKTNNIIAISNYVKKKISEIYEINPDKIIVINRGINCDLFDGEKKDEKKFINFLRNYNIKSNKKIVLFPGRLTGWKGQIEFLKVIEYFKDQPIAFYFVGDDKNKSYLQNLKKNIINKNLNFQCNILGNLNSEELKMMYMCSDVVISAPLNPEGFGRSISEALSMKKIILAYNVGGAKDQLEGLDDIYKIKNQSIENLIARIKIALSLDKTQITNLGNIGRAHIIKNFSNLKMQNSYFNFYQGL